MGKELLGVPMPGVRACVCMGEVLPAAKPRPTLPAATARPSPPKSPPTRTRPPFTRKEELLVANLVLQRRQLLGLALGQVLLPAHVAQHRNKALALLRAQRRGGAARPVLF